MDLEDTLRGVGNDVKTQTDIPVASVAYQLLQVIGTKLDFVHEMIHFMLVNESCVIFTKTIGNLLEYMINMDLLVFFFFQENENDKEIKQ